MRITGLCTTGWCGSWNIPIPPKQIEFAKLYLTNVVTGKRYIKKLVEEGSVDGWG